MKLFILKYFLILLIFFYGCSENENQNAEVNIAEIMSNTNDDFKKAIEPIKFEFPRDYFAHNDYKIEWWYFTGNLKSKNGHKFGYQFTIFRNGLSTDTTLNKSFQTRNMYFAHFAISDINGNNFYFTDKTSREAVNFAGINLNEQEIFIENWKITINYINNDYNMPIFKLIADDSLISINLELKPSKKMVLHGNNGLSQKSDVIVNASYYYSFTNIATIGYLKINGKSYEVEGKSWMDREWSTSALSVNQKGWDWFSLQFYDNSEIMFFRLRDTNDKSDFAKGTFIDENGNSLYIAQRDFSLTVLDKFKTPDGKVYPSKWHLVYDKIGLDMIVETQIPNQELKSFTNYYEGSVKITDNNKNQQIGNGYVELTGY